MAAGGAKEGTATADQGQSSVWTVLGPVLGAIGTGIGVLGFVIFFGGFVSWARFDAAGMPANEAVARIPRNDLLAIGGSFLVPALLLAFGAVAVAVVAWGLLIGNPRRKRVTEAGEAHRDALAELARQRSLLKGLESTLGERRVTLERLQQEHWRLPPNSEERDASATRIAALEQSIDTTRGELSELRKESIPAAESLVARAEAVLKSAPAADPREVGLVVAIGALPMIAVALSLLVRAFLNGIGTEHFALLFAIALATIVVAVAVASMTNFAWYAVCVFLGVGLVFSASTYLEAGGNPDVSPVVALHGSEPVTGFFVAETADSLYIAQPRLAGGSRGTDVFDPRTVTLHQIPMKELKFLAVGSIKEDEDAYRESLTLAMGLCKRLEARASKGKPAPKKETAKPPTCSTDGVGELESIVARLPSASG